MAVWWLIAPSAWVWISDAGARSSGVDNRPGACQPSLKPVLLRSSAPSGRCETGDKGRQAQPSTPLRQPCRAGEADMMLASRSADCTASPEADAFVQRITASGAALYLRRGERAWYWSVSPRPVLAIRAPRREPPIFSQSEEERG